MNTKFDTELENKIIKKINELYITERKTYLTLNKKGEYSSVTKEKWKGSYRPLHDGLIKNHIRGIETIGVFSGSQVSKFICFDIDMIDKSKLKWMYYLLMESLSEIGLDDKYIHVASSGNKGLHLLLFVQDGASLEHFKTLFEETMKLIQQKVDDSIETKLFKGKELKLELKDICFIEFRPSNSQGVKLELGINFKNSDTKTNKCLFVSKDTLKVIPSNKYILTIQAMPKDEFLNLVDNLSNTYETKMESSKSLIKQEIKEPHSHKINKDEDETIEYIVNLIQNGLHMSGTRNNAVFKIAKYFRYMGLELDECIQELNSWMSRQNSKYYSISLEEALSECERIAKSVYEKGYNLVGDIKNLYIYKSEISKIMNIKEKNAKIVFFAMLIHSKRYSLKNGVFYMTFKQIEEMTGVGRKGATNNINILEELGVLEVVERNIKQDHTYMKKPNKYKILLEVDELENDVALEILNDSTRINYLDMYYESTIKLFTNKELRHLPRKQYEEFTSYRKKVS